MTKPQHDLDMIRKIRQMLVTMYLKLRGFK